jgi:cell division protein FtsB
MSEMQVQDAAGEATGLSQWQRVTNTFAAPAKTFEDINRGNRSWWLPLILISVAAYLFFAVVATKIGMQQVVDNQIHMNPAQEERMAQASPEQRETGAKIALYITEGIFAATPVITLGVLALLSLGLMGTINFGFGGKAKYSSVLAVWLYSILPSLVKTLLGIVVIYSGVAPESFNIKNFAPTNLGAFLNPLETNKALYALTTSLDAVQIWSLVLLSIGIATVAGVKRSSGYIAVFGWWAIFVLFGVGMAAMMG